MRLAHDGFNSKGSGHAPLELGDYLGFRDLGFRGLGFKDSGFGA